MENCSPFPGFPGYYSKSTCVRLGQEQASLSQTPKQAFINLFTSDQCQSESLDSNMTVSLIDYGQSGPIPQISNQTAVNYILCSQSVPFLSQCPDSVIRPNKCPIKRISGCVPFQALNQSLYMTIQCPFTPPPSSSFMTAAILISVFACSFILPFLFRKHLRNSCLCESCALFQACHECFELLRCCAECFKWFWLPSNMCVLKYWWIKWQLGW